MALKGEYIYPVMSGTAWTDETFLNTRPVVKWEAVQSKTQNSSDLTIGLYFSIGDGGAKYDGEEDNFSFALTGAIFLYDEYGNSIESNEGIGGADIDGYTDSFKPNSEIFGREYTYINIPHNEDGSIGNISFSLRFKSNYLTGGKYVYCEGVIDIDDIERQAYITSAINFNDEENPVLLYNNPSGGLIQKLEVCIAKDEAGANAIIPYREISTNGNSYTFNFTTAERQALRSATPNANTMVVWYILRSSMWGEYRYSKAQKTLTIIGSMPAIAPTVEDNNATTIALTGNKNSFIKYYSNALYSIGATASKGATITHQQITVGNKQSTTASGVINAVESGKFVFTVADSRNNIASVVLDKNFINYIKLTSNLNITAPDTNGVLKFNIYGNYFAGSFGARSNSLTIQYRYKLSGGSWGNWITTTATITNNTYKSNTITINGLDYRSAYVFQARAVDALTDITSTEYKIQTTPLFDWSETDFNFNVPVTYTENDISYSISDIAKKFNNVDLDNAQLIKLSNLLNVFNTRYALDCEVYAGANYSSASVRLFLYGNMIYGRLEATRNNNAGLGDINNEVVCSVEFDSGKKVIGFSEMSFVNGQTGGLASFEMKDSVIYKNDGSVSEDMVGKCFFNIYLTATDVATSKFSAGFCFPCLLDLN